LQYLLEPETEVTVQPRLRAYTSSVGITCVRTLLQAPSYFAVSNFRNIKQIVLERSGVLPEVQQTKARNIDHPQRT